MIFRFHLLFKKYSNSVLLNEATSTHIKKIYIYICVAAAEFQCTVELNFNAYVLFHVFWKM